MTTLDLVALRRKLEDMVSYADLGEITSAAEILALLDSLEALERATTVPDEAPEDERQWAKLDGAVAWHLIDRHADNWAEIGAQMEAWGRARFAIATQQGAQNG